MTQACASIILAAGKGARMKSQHSKVLHQVAGLPLVCHVLKTVSGLNPVRNIVVVSPDNAIPMQQTLRSFNMQAETIVQQNQKGTADATASARHVLQDFNAGTVLVLFGDTPFVSLDTMQAMLRARSHASIVVLGFETASPTGYGRLIMEGDQLDRIVEEKDASDLEKAVTLCNSGVMAIAAQHLFPLIDKVRNNNAQGEYYITDLPALAKQQGLSTTVVIAEPSELQGVNSRTQLAHAEHIYQQHRRITAMDDGVTLIDPSTVYFSHDTVIENDVVVEPNVVFAPGVVVKNGATIRAFSHLEGTTVEADATIGPYARLRPGTHIGTGAKIGNFVETKNAVIDGGAKVNHLSYVGDATVGARANIGAGTITCNYDGYFKWQTVIGKNAFIGSNSALVAPITIGDDAMVGAGSTVTKDVADHDLHVARGDGKTIYQGAKKFRNNRKKQKNQTLKK